jgi:pimeloyl-ACP methyl ester carboxylesterase
VGGQSIGANVAIAYGVHREGLAGIMAVAPGHTPENSSFRSFEADYQRALKMIADGTGDRKDSFADQNQGVLGRVTATAKAYISWMDPKGMVVMPLNAAKLSPGVPLLWVIGQDDVLLKAGPDYVYSKILANAKNAYKVVSGGHIDTPRIAATEIVTWLKALD